MHAEIKKNSTKTVEYMITSAQKFNDWMIDRINDFQNHNQALLAFLVDSEGMGFKEIKNYDTLCELAQAIRKNYDYRVSEIPCSASDFGRLVLNANPDVFYPLSPSLPSDVKFELMAEKFDLWAKKRIKNLKTDARKTISWDTIFQQFFHGDGVLEHIQNYTDFCLLADTAKKIHGYPLSNPPCSELDFYKIILTSKSIYLGEQPLEIPEAISKLL